MNKVIIFFIVFVSFFFTRSTKAATCTSSNLRFASTSNTIYVTGPVSCRLTDIKSLKPNTPLQLVDSTNKIWFLGANLKLEQGATLLLHGSSVGGDINELRLKSNNSSSTTSIVWVRAHWGEIDISNTKIVSWDEAANGPDTEYATYKRSHLQARSFLEADGITARESRMDIKNSEISHLGFNGAESYGLSWKVLGTSTGIYDKVNVLGDVTGNKIHHNYFGAYTFGAFGMNWIGNEIYSNIQYGLDPHDDSDNLIIENNLFHSNGNHGMICSQRCDHLTIRNNKSYNNTGNGIMLHRNTNDSLVENNEVYGNGDSGLAIFDSHNNIFRENNSHDNKKYGLRISVGGSGNTFTQNQFNNNTLYGINFYKGTDAPTSGDGRPKNNRFIQNTINGNKGYIVRLKESDTNIFEANSMSGNAREFYITNSTGNILINNNLINNTNNFIHSKINSNNTIKDTPAFSAKIGDTSSSLTVIDTQNHIIQNTKNIPTAAQTTQTTLILTRSIAEGVVNFTRLNFKLIPQDGEIVVFPQDWQAGGYKKWKETGNSSSASHAVGDLNPNTSYDVIVNGSIWNTLLSSSEGKIEFVYSEYGSEKIFEIKERQPTVSSTTGTPAEKLNENKKDNKNENKSKNNNNPDTDTNNPENSGSIENQTTVSPTLTPTPEEENGDSKEEGKKSQPAVLQALPNVKIQ